MEVAHKTAPKRILYVITKSNWGGAQRYVYDLAVAAKEAGHEVLVAAGGTGELVTRLEEAEVSVHLIKSLVRDIYLDAEVSAFFELWKLFRKYRPTLVHLNSSKAGLAALAARLAFVPLIIFTVHGWAWNEDRPRWQKLIIAVVYWFTLLWSHNVISLSHAAAREGERLLFMRGKFRVIHHGVHEIDFKERDDARRALVPGSDRDFWIGTIAELHPIKGLPVLIEAFEHVAPDYPNAELVIMGEGQQRPELERLIQVEGVSESVNLLGHVSQASSYLKALDIFTLPSRSEGLGYVLLEAGSAGLPVVATNVGGIPEIIEHEKTGLLVPSGDREALTDALERLANDSELRALLGKNLQEKVARDFSFPRMLEETFAFYEKNS